MKKHIADKAQLEGFKAKTRLFGCHNKQTNKALDMITDAITKGVYYEVSAYHGCIAVVPDLDEAIEIYNKL